MRKTNLMTATAISLIFAGAAGVALSGGLAGGASAATTITTATTAPVATSTTGDLTLDTAGTITLTSGTAITVDSDNTVTVNGNIAMSSSGDNSTGILINGGHTSGLTVVGGITVTDNFTAADTGSLDTTGALTTTADGIVDGPFATGTGRYGIHSLGTTPFVGDVNITAGTIDVEGNNSYGIRFENNINGAFNDQGAMTMIGDNDTGISLEGGATGNVRLGGSATMQGKNSSAVNLNGDFGGTITVDGSFTGTGYATITPSSLTAAQLAALTPDDFYQDGTIFSISGNVAHGILFESVPVTDATNTSLDQDGDGILDTAETTSAIQQYGSAPALRIGSSTGDMTVGGLTFSASAIAPPAIDYGLALRGTIATSGVYTGVGSTAVQIGGLGHQVAISNGIDIAGQITSAATNADTTAFAFDSGASTPELDISSTLNGTTTTTNGTTGRAIDIASGASLPKIVISGSGGVYAASNGSTGNVTAIRDQSNTLTSITNDNIIDAVITASDDNADGFADTIVNSPIAIDTRTNTVGLTLTQTDTALTDDTIAAPSITGGILLGSGNDSISSSGGTISGTIDFGGGANSFTLTNGATFIGRMTGSGTVNLDDSAGSVGLALNSKLNLTNLHVGATSVLAFTLNTTAPGQAILTDSGAATFDNGASVAIALSNILLAPTQFTLLTASSVNLGTLNVTDLSGNIPFLYHADLVTNASNTALYANFRLKTAAEGGYTTNEYNALNAVLTAASADPGGATSLLTPTTQSAFKAVYGQYLPDYSGENLLNLSHGDLALNQTLAGLTLIPDNGQSQFWLQENGYHTTRPYGDTAGFKATGFSFAGGREQAVASDQMLGIYLGYTSASPLNSFAIAKSDDYNSDVTIGGYWRLRHDGFKAWAHAGVGFAQMYSTRELLTPSVTHIASAKWNGYSYSAGAGASMDYTLGAFGVTPQIMTDYYDLNESKHSETGGGDSFDLNIAARDGHLFSSTAQVYLSYNKMFVKPAVWIGWKQNISANIADTVATFPGGAPFTLTGGNIKGGGPVAGFRLSADNQYSYFSLEGDYQKNDSYTDYTLSVRTRFQF